ncbi:helix-turn-helix transcriptional regulator [Catenulispora yoronensis]|uniref:Helix-turn-helix transcriptional regulator n=1 Tax=Catenulispora yoronensis TaxID=450799 RepID=A0ABP5GS73_9ACTN
MTDTGSEAVAGGSGFGLLLRTLRRERRVSQLELSSSSGVSTRHLSFIETGRSRPSREMVALLAANLGLPRRERNTMLVAAGFAPEIDQWSWYLPEMAAAPEVTQRMLDKHMPFPAMVTDPTRSVVAKNAALAVFSDLVDPEVTLDPNVFRLTLHPNGLAPHLVNYGQVRRYLVDVLRHMALTAANPRLDALLAEVEGYPAPRGRRWGNEVEAATGAGTVGVTGMPSVPALLWRDGVVLGFFGVIATFCSVADTTVTPLNLETMYPADEKTERLLRRWYGDSECEP